MFRRRDQVPADLPGRDRIAAEPDPGDGDWVEPGNSVICDPGGKVVAGPLRHEEGILTTTIDLSRVAEARRFFDPVGHYHRPDVFSLSVDTRARPAVSTTS